MFEKIQQISQQAAPPPFQAQRQAAPTLIRDVKLLLPLCTGYSGVLFPSRWRQSSRCPSAARPGPARRWLPRHRAPPGERRRCGVAPLSPRRVGATRWPGLDVSGDGVRWQSTASIFRGTALERWFKVSPLPLSSLTFQANHRDCGPCAAPGPGPAELLRNMCLCKTGHLKWRSARPATVNVLLVHSWHILLPDRFLQSKYFGAKRGSPAAPVAGVGIYPAQCFQGLHVFLARKLPCTSHSPVGRDERTRVSH